MQLSKSYIVYYIKGVRKLLKWCVSFIMIVFLASCNVEPDKASIDPEIVDERLEEGKNEEPQVEENPVADDRNIADYFPKENIIKHFKGVGNEYASEVETIFQREEEFLPTYVNNGGTQLLVIYQLSNEGIYTVYKQEEYYEETPPSIDKVQGSFQKEEVLISPLEKGRMINDWEIVGINETLSLPYGTLDEIIILEKTYEDGSKSRNYWAKDLGLVKKEYYFKGEDDLELIVTTELEKVERITK